MQQSALPKDRWTYVVKQYQSGLSMRAVAEELGISLDAVTYILRRLEIPRRSAQEANQLAYKAKLPSFSIKSARTVEEQLIEAIGATLYWGEGYKSIKAKGIDFANSDVRMVEFFMKFLRTRYTLDEKRLRVLLYCYSDQDINSLITFWSKKLRIPKTQFTRPYIRTDYREDGRKMPRGLVHIRYADKKLLRDVLNLIESFSS